MVMPWDKSDPTEEFFKIQAIHVGGQRQTSKGFKLESTVKRYKQINRLWIVNNFALRMSALP